MEASESQDEVEQIEKLDPSMINSEYHIVYKRKDTSDEHTSDYRESALPYIQAYFK